MNLTKTQATTLAVSAYNAYGAVTDHKNFRGEPMPAFEALPEKIQDAWRAAVSQVRIDLIVGPHMVDPPAPGKPIPCDGCDGEGKVGVANCGDCWGTGVATLGLGH